jgi:hypothetical protein
MRTACLSVLLCATFVQISSAAPGPFFQGTGDAASFRSFEDDAGGFYIVWADAGKDKAFSLRAQHWGPKGDPLWPAEGLTVTSQLALAQDWSGLADGQGGLTLYWDEADGVHAQRFRPDGARRRPGNSVRMSSSTAIQPDAVPDAAGGTLIVWRETLPAGRSVLMGQRFDSDGKPVWPKGGIRVSLRASNQTNPRVIYDNVSGMIVAWRDEVNNASELRVQRMDFQGNRLWTLEGLKVTAPLGLSEFPQIAPLGTGEAVFAWTASANQTNQIFLQKAGRDASLKWNNMQLPSRIPVGYNRWNPLLLGDEGGGTWIAWEDFRDQRNYQIQLNHLHGDGKSVWPDGEIAVAPAPGDQGKMAMTHDGKDSVWLAWIDNRLATIGLYVQEVDGSGRRLQGKAGRLVADQLNKPTRPQLVALETGKVAIVWADRPKKGEWALFWSVIQAPPPQQ